MPGQLQIEAWVPHAVADVARKGADVVRVVGGLLARGGLVRGDEVHKGVVGGEGVGRGAGGRGLVGARRVIALVVLAPARQLARQRQELGVPRGRVRGGRQHHLRPPKRFWAKTRNPPKRKKKSQEKSPHLRGLEAVERQVGHKARVLGVEPEEDSIRVPRRLERARQRVEERQRRPLRVGHLLAQLVARDHVRGVRVVLLLPL